MSLKNTPKNKKKLGASSGSMLKIGEGSFGKNKSVVKACSGSALEIGKEPFGKSKYIVSINIWSMAKTMPVEKFISYMLLTQFNRN